MIYPELKNYLIQVTSSETVDLFDRAIGVFDKYEVPAYMDVFENTLSGNSDNGTDTIIDYLTEDARLTLSHLLTIQGLTLIDAVSFSDLIVIADALFDLPYYEDKVTLNDIMSTDETDREKLGMLFTLITPYSVEYFLPLIIELSDSFITNFKEQLTTVESSKVDMEIVTKHIDAYIKFKDLIVANAPHYADKYFMQSETIGLPYADYINQYQIDKVDSLHDTDSAYINTIAQELVGLTTLSSDGIGNPLLVIRQHLEKLYPDIPTSTKMDIAVSKIVLQYTQ